MELFQERNRHKSIKNIFIAVVLANGRLLFTTGDILLICCIIVRNFLNGHTFSILGKYVLLLGK